MRGFSIRGFSRVLVTLGLLGVIPAGCSIFGGDDGDPTPGSDLTDLPNGSSPDSGATPPSSEIVVAGNPDDSELNEQFGVFVSARGSDSGNGTRTAPLATLAAGIRLAKQFGRRVYACAGTYKENVVMEDGVPMLGSIDCSSGWKFSPTMRARVEAPSSPALTAKGLTTATRLDGFEIIAPDAVRPSENSVAVFAVNSVGLTIAHSRLQAGRGGDGVDGAAATALSPAGNPNGANGEDAYTCNAGQCTTASSRAAGGDGTCAGAAGHDGLSGGTGGRGGTIDYTVQGAATPVTYLQKAGALIYPFVDNAGDGLAGEESGGAGGTSSLRPQDGAAGLAGKDGSNGAYVLTESGITVGHGTKGTDGEPGKGGGGDRGYSASGPAMANSRVRGWGGGGGGAGGCPGLAGEPGTGGGASVALAAYLSPVRVETSEIVTGTGGKGGRGTFPSAATSGGLGGLIVDFNQRAGHGGAGGRGGISNNGSGGPSLGIGWFGTEQPVVTETIYQLGTGGAGVPAKTQGGLTIPASADGAKAESSVLAVPM